VDTSSRPRLMPKSTGGAMIGLKEVLSRCTMLFQTPWVPGLSLFLFPSILYCIDVDMIRSFFFGRREARPKRTKRKETTTWPGVVHPLMIFHHRSSPPSDHTTVVMASELLNGCFIHKLSCFLSQLPVSFHTGHRQLPSRSKSPCCICRTETCL